MNCESIKVTVAESKKEGLWLQRSIRGLCQVHLNTTFIGAKVKNKATQYNRQ